MKNFLYYLGFLIVGFLIGYFSKCNLNFDLLHTEKIITKIDTIEKIVQIKVVSPEEKFVYLSDTVERIRIDSYFTEIIHTIENNDSILVNSYSDSISDPDYKLKYNIETIGFLHNFDYKLDIYRKTEIIDKTKKPKWMISGAISNRGNFKAGVGYRGWTVEAELDDRLQQVYFGKQYNF